MPKYTYSARNQKGEYVSGSEDAENSDVLITRLQLRGLFVTGIKAQAEAKETESVPVRPAARRFSHRGIKQEDLTLFARQLATILGSGVPLLKSLNAIVRQVDSRNFCSIVEKITVDVEAGLSLRDALAVHPKVFSPLWVNLVETGEASGNLPLVLERLANYLEKRASFRRKIVSALVYPAILMCVAVIAIIIFVLVIIPRFTEIFKGFDIVLPLPTRILIFLSDTIRQKIHLIFIGFGGIIFAARKFVRNKKGKAAFDRFVFKVPVLNDFLRVSETEKFTSTMATLLESGVPILYALDIAERSVDNTLVQQIVREVNDCVREGKSLVQPLEKSNFFSPLVVQMVSIGEEIGELDKMFQKVASFYEEILEIKITRFTILFEPLMIVFMGIIIGTMVVSMFLPIFQIANLGSR